MDRELKQSVTAILGGNHLLGSAGEFGLLLAFLHNSPRTQLKRLNPAFSAAEIAAMFKEKRLPEGWDQWEKTWRHWLLHTLALAGGSLKALVRLRLMEPV